jgi:hypothetical protein
VHHRERPGRVEIVVHRLDELRGQLARLHRADPFGGALREAFESAVCGGGLV